MLSIFIDMKKYLTCLLVIVKIVQTFSHQIDVPVPCRGPQDCIYLSHILTDTPCKDGFCVCKYGEEIRKCSGIGIMGYSNRSAGVPIFRSCKVDQDCTLDNFICNKTINQCDCKRGYILSTTKKECLKKADKLDFPCVDDKQCSTFLSNTTCQNNKCNCVPGYHHEKDACYKTIGIGKPCNQTEECAHVSAAECIENGICSCPAETVINTNEKKCLPVVRGILENCVENVQCTSTFFNTLCIDQSCQCRGEYHFEPEENKCFINKGIDETCGNTYECYQTEYEDVTQKALRCVQNVCECAENYKRTEENRCENESSRLLVQVLPIFFVTMICVLFR